MAGYELGEATEKGRYQVEPDVWVYLFENGERKYVLVAADYLGDFEFEVFPHLLKFENGEFSKLEFVLQREISARDDYEKPSVVLFEYT